GTALSEHFRRRNELPRTIRVCGCRDHGKSSEGYRKHCESSEEKIKPNIFQAENPEGLFKIWLTLNSHCRHNFGKTQNVRKSRRRNSNPFRYPPRNLWLPYHRTFGLP